MQLGGMKRQRSVYITKKVTVKKKKKKRNKIKEKTRDHYDSVVAEYLINY